MAPSGDTQQYYCAVNYTVILTVWGPH